MGKVEHNPQTVLALLDSCHAPAVFRLIHNAGIERHPVIRGGGGTAGIVDADLLHAGHSIGAGAQLGGQGDGVARVQGVDLAEIIAHSPVVASETGVAVPNAGIGEVARAFEQRGAAGALIHPHRQADGGDLEGAQAAVAVVEVACHLGVTARGVALGDAGGAAAGDLGHGDVAAAHRGVLAGDDGAARRASVDVGAAHLVHQPAAESAGDEVGREILTAAGEVAGGRPEAGGDQGGVLAPIHVGVLPLVDGVVAGGLTEEVILRGVEGILQGAGLGDAQGA